MPTVNAKRVPLARLARAVGGRRGGLGGWIGPLSDVEESLRSELEHPNFPVKFPDAATGGQSLEYILDVWRRARSSPEGLANEVRDTLPVAYAYCLEDCAGDEPLARQWETALPEAMVFAEREWIAIGADNLYLDNIRDRRFLPDRDRFRTVTGGHLGRSPAEQCRTASEIGLPALSSSIELQWHGVCRTEPADKDRSSRFALVWNLLQSVRGNEAGKDGGSETSPTLHVARELAVDVRFEMREPERVPVNARLDDGRFVVAGRSVEFGSDAAKELLRELSFGQRADLSADLTGMLVSLDNGQDFALAAEKFGRSHVPDFESPPSLPQHAGDSMQPPSKEALPKRSNGAGLDKGNAPGAESASEKEPGSGNGMRPGVTRGGPEERNGEKPRSTGGSYTREQAMARQNALAEQLKDSLKGEIVPPYESDGKDESRTTGAGPGATPGDEEFREMAARYEREAGRRPEFGDPGQPG